ncbi:GIY-YIG nuclease family protein [Croceibacterium ferulae]|uniref:GIY-YIG nuclease family protein n=1 Tax=Croceibacterium ferulae TaxID=1854641 RepID=UPI001F4DE2B5|nr:GIY-YIG nuclease family protein [Croceibacterium ferulae]
MKGGWVYTMAYTAHGTLYVGVTADIAARVTQHREGRGSVFAREHGCTRLVTIERHEGIADAIRREKQVKAWKRQWKLRLIRAGNPDWRDLSEDLLV